MMAERTLKLTWPASCSRAQAASPRRLLQPQRPAVQAYCRQNFLGHGAIFRQTFCIDRHFRDTGIQFQQCQQGQFRACFACRMRAHYHRRVRQGMERAGKRLGSLNQRHRGRQGSRGPPFSRHLCGSSPSPSGSRVPDIKNILRPMRILRFQITTARPSVFGRNGPVPPGSFRGPPVPQWKEHHRLLMPRYLTVLSILGVAEQ